MDIVDTCKAIIEKKFEELDRQQNEADVELDMSTQNTTVMESYIEGDKNVTKILNQQANLKRIIDQDNTIQLLKSSLNRVALEIEGLRSACTKLNEEALKSRQELAQAQAKELERYQMNQIKSISDAYSRHQEILELRKEEISALKREIEREEKDRDAYLADVEKKLEKQLQDRQRAIRGGSLPFGVVAGPNQAEQQDLELTSVDEYAPYGTAPHSRMPSNSARGAARGRCRGKRGRRG